jgi:AcrR family transcriptional regulator
MRADAIRNLDKVLATGARLLARDPTTTIAKIAAEAGVDRATVYRRFDSRDALLAAIYQARYDAVEQAIDEARLTEAPVVVALHRYVEGIIVATRQWPVDLQRLGADAVVGDRRARLTRRVDDFVERAVDDGLFRADLPDGWIAAYLRHVVHLAADEFPDLDAAPAADLAVDSLLRGAGRH